MAGIPGSHPSNLPNQIPVDEQPVPEAMDAPLPATTPAPTPAPTPVPMQEDPIDAIIAKHTAAPAPAAGDPIDAIIAKHTQAAAPAGNIPGDFSTRFKAGFAANESEKANYLRKVYGPENVAETSEGIKYKREDGKWHFFQDDIKGMGDPANLGRIATVEIGALPAEVTGMALAAPQLAGIPATGGLSGLSAGATLTASRVAGGMMGEYLARGVAGAVGIPRNKVYAENPMLDVALQDFIAAGTEGGTRAVMGKAADYVAAKAVDKMTPKNKALNEAERLVVDAINEISAPMRARTSAALDSIKKTDWKVAPDTKKQLQSHIDEALEIDAASQKAGFSLLPHEEFPTDPTARRVAESAVGDPKFRRFNQQRVELANEIVDKWIQEYGKGSAKEAGKVGDLGKVVYSEYGPAVGSYREKALAQAGGQVFSVETKLNGRLPSFKDGVAKAAELTGFIADDGTSRYAGRDALDVAGLAEQLSMRPDNPDVQWLHGFMGKQNDKLNTTKNMYTLKEADDIVKQLTRKINNMLDRQGNLRSEYSQDFYVAVKGMRDGMRDSFTEHLGNVLGGDDKAGYQAAKQTYAMGMDALEGMANLFKRDNPTTKAVVNYISNSADALDRVRALKLLAREKPEILQNVKAAYVQQLMDKIAVRESDASGRQIIGNYDMRKMLDLMKPSSQELQVMSELLGDEATKSALNMAKTLSSFQNKVIDSKVAPGMLGRIIAAGGQLIKLNPELALEILNSNKAAKTLMRSTDRAKLFSKIARKDATMYENFLNRLEAMQSGVLSTAARTAPTQTVTAPMRELGVEPNQEQR